MNSVVAPAKPSASYPLPATDGVSYMAGSSGSTAALSPAPRPNYVRRETDQILSYYQSDLAGRPYATAADMDSQRLSTTTHSRKGSTASSSSDYSSEYSSESFGGLGPPPLSTSQTTTPVRADFALHPEHPPTHNRNASTSSYSSEHSSKSLTTPEFASTSQATTPVGANTELLSEDPAHGRAARHSRRPSVPSEGGADRRRVAIVEMDAAAQRSVSRKRSKGLSDAKSSSSSSMSGGTLFSRRGVNIGGLALVAPPDAAPKAYTDLTPPSTAPADRASHPPPSASSHYHAHARSASEAVDPGGRARRLHHKSSRDVGIVGLSSASSASDSLGPASPTSDDYHSYVHTEGLGVPVFQTPAKSRSPSPGGGTPDLSDTSSASAHHRSLEQRLLSTPIFGMEDGIVTPGIGEWKDIQQPVVGPVIVGLPPEMMQRAQPRRPASAAPPQHSHSQPSSSVQSPTSRSPNYQSSHSSSPASSPYLHYQPGVHATAGPLPPPPRSIFDNTAAAPPRPPRFHTPVPTNNRPVPANTKREIEAIKEKLQLPQSVSAVLAARTPPETNRRLGHNPSPSRSDTRDSEESTYSQDNGTSVKLVPASSVHRREGAFPPSTIMTSPPRRVGEEQSTSSHMVSSPVVVIEPEREEDADEDTLARERKDSERRSGIELLRKSSWVSLSEEATELLSSPNGKSAALPKPPPISRSASSVSGGSSSSSSSGSSRLPVPPPKNGRGGSDDERQQNSLAPSSFRATLTNLKRFSSLPRTPSRSSRSSKRSTSPEARRSLSPSIEPIHVELPPRRRMTPRPTKISSWPQAMVTRDVTMLRSARERAKMYAEKINELAEYDCGLRDWMASQRPGSHPRTQSQRTALQPTQLALPAELGGMAHTNRHVSHGSLASQATFPIRADAYTATDLSTRSIDIIPSSSPPTTLPYPSLAQANLSRAQMRSSTLLSSPTKSPLTLLPGAKGSGTGFFASLGRKTSVRREKGLSGLSSPQSPTKLLTKRPPPMAASRSNPSNSTSPRDGPLPTAPAIPGGPRAAPGRIQRSKTYSVSASPPQSSPPENPHPPIQSPTSPQSSQRQSAIPRRPSLFARARPGHSSVGSPAPNVMDPAFQRQVDKLAAILPHADRAILAGYLRRAGEDILAIGQYLEDEKNGTLQRE